MLCRRGGVGVERGDYEEREAIAQFPGLRPIRKASADRTFCDPHRVRLIRVLSGIDQNAWFLTFRIVAPVANLHKKQWPVLR